MNSEIITLAIIVAVPPTITALAAFIQATRAKEQAIDTHKAVDGRMTELLALARKESASQAILEEKEAEHIRKGEAAIEAAKPRKEIV